VDTYGYTREELAKMTAGELLPPEERESYLAEMARRPADARVSAARTHVTKSGRRLAVEVSTQPLLYGSRRARLVVARDVTGEQEAKRAIRTSEERLRGTLDNTPGVAVQWFDRDGRIQYWNRASELLYGVPAALAVGRSFTDIGVHTPEQNREFLDLIAGIERSGTAHGPDELTLRTPRGAEVTVLYTMFMIPGIGGGNTFVCMDVDITERKRAEERIQYLATRDGLTGLPNRLLVSDRLAQAIAACKREGTQLAVLFMDLDRFKLVNDSLGHEMGDRLLCEVAARIGASMRQEDTLARLGGDEFVILAYGLHASEAAAGIAQKILAAVATPFVMDGHTINATASIGISVHPADASDVQGLLRNADIAMYQAKDHGGGRYEFYSDEMNARVVERQRIEG
jgi:diguanylate cyclase (GGDEF)-like protein/PAS domain S-box-containing protein